jgi:glutathione S-transferase
MIQLYLSSTCPFCLKVVKAANAMGLREGVDYATVDSAPGTPGADKVRAVGGDYMVPFLIDGDHFMYESDDIIEYMRKKTATP